MTIEGTRGLPHARRRKPDVESAWLSDRARPTSLKFIGNTAYIVTLGGDIWTIDICGYSEHSGGDE